MSHEQFLAFYSQGLPPLTDDDRRASDEQTAEDLCAAGIRSLLDPVLP